MEVPAPSHEHREQSSARMPEVRPATAHLREIMNVSEAFERSLQQALSVNPTGLDAMGHLIMSGPLSPGDLSRRLRITTAATTAAVDRLVDLGHVQRSPHPTDRRSVVVTAEPESVARAMSHLAPLITQIDTVLDDFTPEEHSVIDRYLSAVIDVYRRSSGAESATDQG